MFSFREGSHLLWESPSDNHQITMRSNSIRAIVAGLVSAVVMMTACDKYDDSALVARMDKAENDIKELRTLVEKLNTDLTSLATVVDGLKKQDKIVSVSELPDKSGYKVVFSESGEFTIYNGKNGIDGNNGKDGTNGTNGEDGKTPTIGVKLDTDGNYYWTVNGEYLLDDQGNKIAATAHVATPQLRINEGNFEISYNGGVTWEVIGSAGNAGNVVFSKVEDGETAVTFTLADGTEIVIPKVQQFAISISTDVVIGAGESTNVPYTITASDEATVVDSFGTKGFEAEVTMTNASSGIIQITAPDPLTTGKVYIIAVRGDGNTAARILSFEEGKLLVDESIFAAKVPAAGGTVEIPVQSNIEFDVMVDPGSGWISYVETKAMRNNTIVLSVAENTSADSREGSIIIASSLGMKRCTIVQAGTAETPATGGGKADLETMNGGARNTTVGTYQTENGWVASNSRVNNALKSGTPRFEDMGEGYRPILAARGSLVGSLTSPILNGGCGKVTVDYTRFTAQQGSNLTIEIKDTEGKVIKTESHVDETLAQWERGSLDFDFNISGDFQIVVTTNKCSNTATTANDDLMIISLAWTGYSK